MCNCLLVCIMGQLILGHACIETRQALGLGNRLQYCISTSKLPIGSQPQSLIVDSMLLAMTAWGLKWKFVQDAIMGSDFRCLVLSKIICIVVWINWIIKTPCRVIGRYNRNKLTTLTGIALIHFLTISLSLCALRVLLLILIVTIWRY